jgi:hypothetical protein
MNKDKAGGFFATISLTSLAGAILLILIGAVMVVCGTDTDANLFSLKNLIFLVAGCLAGLSLICGIIALLFLISNLKNNNDGKNQNF